MKKKTISLLTGIMVAGSLILPVQAKNVDEYPDVQKRAWYYNTVKYVSERNMMMGYDNGKFEPEKNMTRAEFTTILYRIAGAPSMKYESCYSDVADNMFYSQAVTWAKCNGIVSGYDDGTFGPNDEITREQMVTILYRYEKFMNGTLTAVGDYSHFSDGNKVSNYASEAMKWAVGNELIKGNDNGTLEAKANTTRAVCASIITRYSDKSGDLGFHPVIARGWKYENNAWYYITEKGEKQTGWITIAGKRYHFDSTGKMKCGSPNTESTVTCKSISATCMEDGYIQYSCSQCGETYREKNADKVPHDYDMTVEVERVNSTCTTHGHVNYACKVCGDIHTEELELDPNNHTFVETGRDLQYIYYKCSECGATSKEFNDQEYTIDLGNGQTTTVVGHFDLEMRQQILNIVNNNRSYYGGGIPLLTLVNENTTLQKAADIRAIEITYLYSHTRPNGERAIMSLYPFAHTDAENLAEGQTSAEMVCNDWFSSSTHVDNLISTRYHSIGISVFCTKDEDGKYVNYFSQLFSTLLPKSY